MCKIGVTGYPERRFHDLALAWGAGLHVFATRVDHVEIETEIQEKLDLAGWRLDPKVITAHLRSKADSTLSTAREKGHAYNLGLSEWFCLPTVELRRLVAAYSFDRWGDPGTPIRADNSTYLAVTAPTLLHRYLRAASRSQHFQRFVRDHIGIDPRHTSASETVARWWVEGATPLELRRQHTASFRQQIRYALDGRRRLGPSFVTEIIAIAPEACRRLGITQAGLKELNHEASPAQPEDFLPAGNQLELNLGVRYLRPPTPSAGPRSGPRAGAGESPRSSPN